MGRIRISNDSLNSYGTRVLTAGMDVKQYERNPVLLYMHQRGSVIGYVKDLKVENNEVTGELVFDEASELSTRCKKQYEVGSLRMVSVGIDIIEMSEDKDVLVKGQTAPTITKSKLFEVSLVDIGANDDALVLKKDGKTITLGKGENPLPVIKNKKTMEQKTLALQLGLSADADEKTIATTLTELKAAKEENVKLKAEVEKMEAARVEAVVDDAVNTKRITPERKAEFLSLGKEIGLEKLESIFSAMSPAVSKLSAVLRSGSPIEQSATFSKLSEVSAEQAVKLREEDPQEYARLYKAEYGIECEF